MIFKSFSNFFFHAKETQGNFKLLLLNYNHIVKQTRDLEREFCIRTHFHPLSIGNGWIMEDWASLVIYVVKNLPEKWETRIQSLSGEDAREKGMATHSSILAWRIPWTESLADYSPWGRKELDTTE